MNGRLLITALLNICFLTVSSKGLSGQESRMFFLLSMVVRLFHQQL